MKACILVGGRGTRLKPLTDTIAKPMMPVGDRTFLEFIFDWLKKYGITDVVLLTGHMSEKFTEYYGDGSKFGVSIEYTGMTEPMGTGGQLKPAEKFVNDTFVVVNGDTFFPVNLDKLKEFHDKHSALLSIALRTVPDTSRYGAVVTDQDDKIIEFTEKGEHRDGVNTINGGIYMMSPKVLGMIPDGFCSLEQEIFPIVDELYGTSFNDYFIDIGTHETYDQFLEDMKNISGQ